MFDTPQEQANVQLHSRLQNIRNGLLRIKNAASPPNQDYIDSMVKEVDEANEARKHIAGYIGKPNITSNIGVRIVQTHNGVKEDIRWQAVNSMDRQIMEQVSRIIESGKTNRLDFLSTLESIA